MGKAVVRYALASDGPGSVPITGLTIDNLSLNRFDNDGDIWVTTWADDGNLYTAGGDGLGFDGIDTRGLDVNRQTAAPDGDLAAGGTELFNKVDVLPKGLISVDGVLYLAEQDRTTFQKVRFGRSIDHGVTWTYPAGVGWDYDGLTKNAFTRCTFAQYGQDYAGGPAHVYILDQQSDDGTGSLFDELILARVPKASVDDVATHEYFSGTPEAPAWSADPESRTAILRRVGAIHWGPSLTWNPVLNRFVLAFFTNNSANLAIYEGPNPWGPWTLVTETPSMGGDTTEKFMVNFVNKDGWLSADGLTWWFVVSGLLTWDAFNVMKATLTV